MKKSEKLMIESQKADSDARAYSLMKKSEREKRYEYFKEKGCNIIYDLGFSVKESDNDCFSIDTGDQIFDYFPKGNKVRQRSINRWIKSDGFNWLINKLQKIKKNV